MGPADRDGVPMVAKEVAIFQHRRRLIDLEDERRAALAGAFKIAEQMSGTRSSTAQDMARGKRTEIDSLNGHVARLGEETGVPTPVNHTLYTLVKLQEASF